MGKTGTGRSGAPRARTRKEPSPWERAVEGAKWEVARSLGLDTRVETAGWGGLPAREAGRIGGKLRGRLRLDLARQVRLASQNGERNPPARRS